MTDGWTPAEKELRDALLDELGYVLPGEWDRVAAATLRVFEVLERLRWAKQAPSGGGT